MIGALLVFLAILITPAVRDYLSQRSQINQLSEQVAVKQTNIDSMQKRKAQWSDPKYVEAQAGQRLGFAKPGQTLTVYVTNASTSRAQTVAAAKQKDTWYGQLWQSVVKSGKQH